MRPEVGTQAQFKKKKPPQTYRYDSSLSPSMEWDGENPSRETGEALLAEARSQNSEVRKRLAVLKNIDPQNTDYNGLCFHVSQAFFPRTGAWENLKKALKGDYEESVWDHLAGTVSAPFAGGEHGQVAVKVIDQRGNELLAVRRLEERR